MPKLSYRHLQPEERVTLASLTLQGKSLRQIAQVLGHSAATLSRESRRYAASTNALGASGILLDPDGLAFGRA